MFSRWKICPISKTMPSVANVVFIGVMIQIERRKLEDESIMKGKGKGSGYEK